MKLRQTFRRSSTVIALAVIGASFACGEEDPNDGGGAAYPPTAPSGLTATAESATSIALTWTDRSSTETRIVVEARTEASDWAVKATLSKDVTSYSDSGLTASTVYSYRVKAGNAAGDSSYSSTATATTLASSAIQLAVPTNVKVTPLSATALEVSWTDTSTGEVGFDVERSTSASATFTKLALTAADATSYVDSGLSAGTYYYRVRAVATGTASDYTSPASGTPSSAPSVPATPTNLTATAQSSTQILVSWTDASSNETGFELEQATSIGGAFTLLALPAANVTSYVHGGLAAGTTRYYRIRATNGVGDSANSNTAQATTPGGGTACTAAATRCIAGNVDVMETCNASGTGWTRTTCHDFALCTNGQCRDACGLTSTPSVPTICAVPNGDGVNSGTWLVYADDRLAPQTYVIGGSLKDGGGAAPISAASGQTWPYQWSIGTKDQVYFGFKLSQFSAPKSERFTWRAKRSGVIDNGLNYYLGSFRRGTTPVYACPTDTSVSYNWETRACLCTGSYSSSLDWAGGQNYVFLTIGGDGFGSAPDLMHVNWIRLGIE